MAKIIWRVGKAGITVLLVLLFLGLIFYSTKVFTPAHAEEPSPPAVQIAAEFEQAQALIDAEKFDEAWQVYAGISEQYAMTAYDLEVRVLLVKLYIAEGNVQEAEVAIENLYTDFPGQEEIADAVYQLAACYRKEKDDRAVELYQYIIDTHPLHDLAIRAQSSLAKFYIVQKEYSEAQANVEKLLTDFAGDERLARYASSIAWQYLNAENYEKARDLYDYVVNSCPNTDNRYTLRCRGWLVISDIALGNYQNAEDGTQKLITDFAGDERLPEYIWQIASGYSKRGEDLRGRQVYQDFLDNCSNPELDIWARTIAIIADDDAADPNAVYDFAEDERLAEVDRLIADFEGHERLDEVVYCISDEFYNRALDFRRKGSSEQVRKYLQRAAKVWEEMVNLGGNSDKTIQACQLAGDCYRLLGQHEKALEFYQYLVETWPDCKLACRGQYLIGYTYERLNEGGVVDREEANTIIEATYTQLLEDYPDCSGAKAASGWLRSNSAAKKGGQI